MVYDEFSDEIVKSYNKMIAGDLEALKEDKYYQYFYNLLESARNYAKFSYVRLAKFVDERWVEQIEIALPSIQTVIQNPRKYIEEEHEVVNIAMARNVSSESVRHLLMHSNYIDEYREDGTVIPNKILTTYKEESLNTYENRFICTLVTELQQFVNKRYKAIFDASVDEMGVNFDVSSTIDNYTEVIDYKLKMSIRDKQVKEENEEENSDIFSRIANIHQQINMLASTEFMRIMKRFPVVRHPIVKTNAIAKNRYYKACHELWNFLHAYDKVGYKVDMVKQDPEIAGGFQRDIFNTIAFQYAMLHNFMEGVDELNLDRKKRKKELNIQQVRGLLEEIVDGLDVPDENLRRIVARELKLIQTRKKQEREEATRVNRQKKERQKKNEESKKNEQTADLESGQTDS